MLVLLVLSSIAAALVPVERNGADETATSTSSTSTTPVDEGELITRRVSTGAATPPTIRMNVRDELRLTVTSPVSNIVEIPEFGEFEDVDPDFPATFNILPLAAGEFAVRLVEPPGLVATIQVEP